MSEDKSAGALATFDDFMKIDIRCGTVVEAAPFPEARKPAIKLVIDFGADIGTRKNRRRRLPNSMIRKLLSAKK